MAVLPCDGIPTTRSIKCNENNLKTFYQRAGPVDRGENVLFCTNGSFEIDIFYDECSD